MKGYLLPESFNSIVNTQKEYSKRIGVIQINKFQSSIPQINTSKWPKTEKKNESMSQMTCRDLGCFWDIKSKRKLQSP